VCIFLLFMGHLFCVRARDPIRFMFNANKMRENQQHFAMHTAAVVMRYFRMRNVLRVCCFFVSNANEWVCLVSAPAQPMSIHFTH
jgi:hypothetical protein